MPASLICIYQVIWSLFLWETSPVPHVTPSPLDAPLLILLSALEVPTPKTNDKQIIVCEPAT